MLPRLIVLTAGLWVATLPAYAQEAADQVVQEKPAAQDRPAVVQRWPSEVRRTPESRPAPQAAQERQAAPAPQPPPERQAAPAPQQPQRNQRVAEQRRAPRGGNQGGGSQGGADQGGGRGGERVAVPRRGPVPQDRGRDDDRDRDRGRPGGWIGDRGRDTNIIIAPRALAYSPRYSYYYPYGYGAFGLGYFYYDPYTWYPRAPLYSYGSYGGYIGRGYNYDIGEVRLRVTPRDAQVFVDGYFAGNVDDFDGTFQALRLESSGYAIEIRKDGFAPIEFKVMVQPGQKINYRGELRPVP